MQGLTVLIISSEFPPGPGGIGNHAHQLALSLHQLGFHISVMSPQDYCVDTEADAFVAAQPFGITRVPSGRGQFREAIHRFRIANRLAREGRPDILVGTGLSGVWVVAALAMFRHLPAAAIAHGSEFGKSRGVLRRINRWAFERMKCVIAVSKFTRTVVEKAGIRGRRVEVIPNAADQHRFTVLPPSERQAFRKKAGFNGEPLLLTVGHVSERKGQEVVIRALPHILKKVPDARYLMVGLPSLKPQLTELARRLGVQDRIHFLGKVTAEDMVQWLNCCDLFAMTSRTTADGDCEGFGIAVVEAALCGKPAVVSAQSGLIEAIENGVTGIAVPEGDELATATAVISLLGDPVHLQRMGEAANARALREQTWWTNGLRYEALLKEIVRIQV